MEKDKMIEEMASDIFNTCAWRFGNPNDYKEICNDIAEDLIKLGYTKNKIPEGSVVLTKEDLKHYAKDCLVGELAGLDILNGLIERAKRKEKQARKETAKEFAEKLENGIDNLDIILHEDNDEQYVSINQLLKFIDKIVKQYGVAE